MHERPKALPQSLPTDFRKKRQGIFEQAVRSIGRDLGNFLRAIGGGGGYGGVTIMGFKHLGDYDIPEKQVVTELHAVERRMPRPWRSHQKYWRRAAASNRQARRAHGTQAGS